MRPQREWSYIFWGLSWLVSTFGLPFESNLTKWVRLANATALGCEGNMLSLTCAGQQEGLKINSAFWGRDDAKTCLPDKSLETTLSTDETSVRLGEVTLCLREEAILYLPSVRSVLRGKAVSRCGEVSEGWVRLQDDEWNGR
ncbi:hypothetical protein OS493_010148 [Desmophyllum pertusum]|uniref:Uncharacterized protein n=1 Tax=Desmophyllum pertusum TaxID=174260 RepID=A0A9W9YHS7_9CNID|nr:hypothetical protein OS493_010148 [Desmophyllum pertusum]